MNLLNILQPSSVIYFIVLITYIFRLTCFGLTLGHLKRLLSQINLKYYYGTHLCKVFLKMSIKFNYTFAVAMLFAPVRWGPVPTAECSICTYNLGTVLLSVIL
jgi:hypothetical protein